MLNGARVIITDHCQFGAQSDTNQVTFDEESWLTIDGIHWPEKDIRQIPQSYIHVARCAMTGGHIELVNVTSIPTGSHAFPVIKTNGKCLNGLLEEEDRKTAFLRHVDHGRMPGGCSNFETERNTKEDGVIDVRINYKDLCGGQIAGIVVGAVVGTVAVGAAGAFAMGGARACNNDYGSSSDYVSL